MRTVSEGDHVSDGLIVYIGTLAGICVVYGIYMVLRWWVTPAVWELFQRGADRRRFRTATSREEVRSL
jgi:hypothetical protein